MALDESACLNYMEWDEKLALEKPYQLVSDDLPDIVGIPRQNFELKTTPIQLIEDIRGKTSSFNVDDNAFAYLKHQFPDLDFEDRADVEQIYQPEVVKMLKEKISGVDEVCFFNWRLRANRRSAKVSKLGDLSNPVEVLVPAHFVHLDQTLPAAIDYAKEFCGDRADWLLKGRLRIFNIWKPYSVVVQDCPLAVCDGSTIRVEDLISCDNVTKARIGEIIMPLYNPNAKWYYMSHQSPNDVTIIKIVDSDPSVKAPCCPHTAFDHVGVDPTTEPRRSIEMRALVFTHPEERP